MKYKEDSPESYKKRIVELSKYNEEELYKYFKAANLGTIVMAYPSSLAQEVYSYFALILKRKYPNYCDENDIVNTLSQYGNIYTAKINPKYGEAVYQLKSANILLYSFLDKLDDSIVHELIHKLGYLKFNDDFYKMPKIYIEAGTELITNTVLERPECKELILGNMWTRCVGVQPAYLVETALVNQLNMACNTFPLERSILDGRNYIETELEALVGKERYLVLFERLNEICRLEKEFWNSGKKPKCQRDIEIRISQFQNDLLESAFDKKFEEIENSNGAKEYLEELMRFSDYRVKSCQEQKYVDEFFDTYFEEKKKCLEQKFNETFDIDDARASWKERFPAIPLKQEELAKKEKVKRQVDEMALKKEAENSIYFKLKNVFRRNKPKETLKLLVSEEATSFLPKIETPIPTINSQDSSQERKKFEVKKEK